jgi:hypothetical protein
MSASSEPAVAQVRQRYAETAVNAAATSEADLVSCRGGPKTRIRPVGVRAAR